MSNEARNWSWSVDWQNAVTVCLNTSGSAYLETQTKSQVTLAGHPVETPAWYLYEVQVERFMIYQQTRGASITFRLLRPRERNLDTFSKGSLVDLRSRWTSDDEEENRTPNLNRIPVVQSVNSHVIDWAITDKWMLARSRNQPTDRPQYVEMTFTGGLW